MNLEGRLKNLERAVEDDAPPVTEFITVDTVLGVLSIPDYALPSLLKVYGDTSE
jgi:hypothetical protein